MMTGTTSQPAGDRRLIDRIEALETENDVLRERVRQLEEQLGMGPTPRMPVEWALTVIEAEYLSSLLKAGFCTKEALLRHHARGANKDDLPEIKIVDVMVCKLRKKLRPYGVHISTLWGRGYALEPDQATLVKGMIDMANRPYAADGDGERADED